MLYMAYPFTGADPSWMFVNVVTLMVGWCQIEFILGWLENLRYDRVTVLCVCEGGR